MFFNPNDVSYRHNENYNPAPITCGADCWECSYSWSGPNSFSVSGAVLDLSPLTKSMAGTYTCTARNVKLSQQPLQTKQLLLEVRFGPDSIYVTNGKSVYTVDEGTRLQHIKCEADCFPACTYKWTKDGQNIGNTETLSLGQVQTSSAGNYTCRATNGDSQSRWKEKKVTIYIRYGPYQSSTKLSPSTQNYTKNEGQSLNDITCTAECYPDCIYTWSKTRQEQTTTVSSTSVLSIGKLHRENFGLYTCIARNPEKISSSTTTIQTLVNVRYGPDSAVLGKTSPRTVTEGDKDEKIECTSDCYPGCSYKWTKSTSSSVITSSRVLQLNTVLRENAGDYKCISTNTATSQFSKSAESTIKIIVQYAPDVNISLSTRSVKEGESLILYCNSHGVPSSYIYTSLFQSWKNVAIPNNNTAVDDTEKYSSLYFKSLRLDDTGTYTCTLNNGISNLSGILDQSGTRELIVQVSPKILKDDLRFSGSTGDAINIEIPIYSNPVLDSIEIKRYDGQSISSDMFTVMDDSVKTKFYGKDVTLQGNVIYLTLNDAKEEDFGNYSFIITNVLDTTQAFFHVIAEGPPLPPKFLQFLSANNILKFVWQKDFNGGLQQYFIIQTSIAGTETWTNLLNVSEIDSKYRVNSTFYTVNITGLSPGKYTARIFSLNSKGGSEHIVLATTFDVVLETEFEGDKQDDRTGVIAAVIISVVLIVSSICIGIFIWKKRKTAKEQTMQNLYESTAQFDSTSNVQYEDLHGLTDANKLETYDSLDIRKDDSRFQAASTSKNDIALQTYDTSDNVNMYENLKIGSSKMN
ncbi:hemicentin-1-like isoform X1 [Ruditapes philippinarum]|uniref:hemicentin-1-like isoform X1 n=1 Tax=Ruditapes philippinarum TaxID=129788 RepID=UPI00295BD61B|nr:hemicentin-1-like isoform X1 [Ruditapes philippinarum]